LLARQQAEILFDEPAHFFVPVLPAGDAFRPRLQRLGQFTLSHLHRLAQEWPRRPSSCAEFGISKLTSPSSSVTSITALYQVRR
jgi:hypothetical protein